MSEKEKKKEKHCTQLPMSATVAHMDDRCRKMSMNATAGTILVDQEINRILFEREQECYEQQSVNTTSPPGKIKCKK
ncbi:calcitonin protein-related peptide type 1 receptor-like isoform X1 [Vespula maculifrons]|uniref:Calcitonin protein-related peptide type 1 receptor-like isoform X1 n=1 Tax=Vespula maculifrons TaxID=7453 RepID=A0ABD2CTU1_VESMC